MTTRATYVTRHERPRAWQRPVSEGSGPSQTLVEKTREYGVQVRMTARLFCVRANANNPARQFQMDRLSVAKCMGLEGYRSDRGVWVRLCLFRNAAHWQHPLR